MVYKSQYARRQAQLREEAKKRKEAKAAREAARQPKCPDRTQEAKYANRLELYQQRIPESVLLEYTKLCDIRAHVMHLPRSSIQLVIESLNKVLDSPHLVSAQRKVMRQLLVLCEVRLLRLHDEELTKAMYDAAQVKCSGNTSKSGFLYVIQDIASGHYKIGITSNWDRRARALGVGSKTRLMQVKSVDDMREAERQAHARYKDYRLPGSEYFNLKATPEI